MARSFLGLTEIEFWNASPRRLIAMIGEWKRIQRGLLGIPEEPDTNNPGETTGGNNESAAFWAAWDKGLI